MHTVGIRELKAHLSRHLKRVRAGTRLVVTERGRAIASIQPIPTASDTSDTEWAHAWVAAGGAHWSGGKPTGVTPPSRLQQVRHRSVRRRGPIKRDTTVSAAVLEDRR
jgi:prevent-host-death family protein